MPTKIDWADETINPIGWGCYGPGGTAEHPNICSYCYAYRIASSDEGTNYYEPVAQERMRRLETALRFYADQSNYGQESMRPIMLDGGTCAREALEVKP